MAGGPTLVHVTHEAAGKIGGIGAVLQGLFTCPSYLKAVERSVVVGLMFTTDGSALDRLGEDGEVLYSSLDGLINTGYAAAFRKIESFYNVGIIYGRRRFIDKQTGVQSTPEVVLLDVRSMDAGPINEFKRRLYEHFGARSDLHEQLWEYEQYIRQAPAAIAVLKAIGAATNSTVVVAHEYMGVPTALAAILDPSCDFKTAFYAHEVATIRPIVEKHPGHDTMFYNVLRRAAENNNYVNELFGDQSSYFKHPLVEASRYCDRIWAVGNYVAEELRFLGRQFKDAAIDIVYNGIPSYEISVGDKYASKEKLRSYCERLLGYRPGLVFTHVTRLVQSKGLWRDLRVLEHLEQQFRHDNRTAVMFLLSTQSSQRRSSDIHRMEAQYNWPVAHREGWPDLCGDEAGFYAAIQEFNTKSRNIKMVFINQFGFDRKHCGDRMPEDMEFMDIRRGTDVEFGQSIYEPFGIAQLEPLTFGGICVFSSVCGCCGFVSDALAEVPVNVRKGVNNIIVADYTDLGDNILPGLDAVLQIGRDLRDRTEAVESKEVADEIMLRLPKSESETERLIQNGYRIARNMSWDVVVNNYLLPSLEKILQHHPARQIHGRLAS